MYWFTADWHNLYANTIKDCKRPFPDVYIQERVLLENYNSVVKPEDTVIYAGDIAMKKKGAIRALENMNGQIIFVLGNHDKKFIQTIKKYVVRVCDRYEFKVGKQDITVSHYAMRTWNKSQYGSWEVFAHSHGNLTPIGLQHDCGVDNNNFFPISFEQLDEIMKPKILARYNKKMEYHNRLSKYYQRSLLK